MPVQPTPVRQAAPQPTQWQTPSNASLAAGVMPQPLPAKVRGVSADAPAVKKFMMPSPEALGVTVTDSPGAAKSPVDWMLIQSRMERLGVLQYKKNALSTGGVRVMMMLPTSNPALGQPVEAQAETESAAIVMALDAAEEWARKR
jgi:hypothetical protein